MDLWSEPDLSPAFALILEALTTDHLANPGVGQHRGRRLSEQAYWRSRVSFHSPGVKFSSTLWYSWFNLSHLTRSHSLACLFVLVRRGTVEGGLSGRQDLHMGR